MSFDLFYELQVLSSAVQYKNLSAAAKHIGLSQPQLSRIIQKIESHMNIVLLDRTAKKNSGWTKIASQISDAFLKNVHRMESDFAGISRDQVTSELHIGTLEGLSGLAINTCQHLYEKINVKKIYLDIFDLDELEARFIAGNIDIAFTVNSTIHKKSVNVLFLGHQKLDLIETNPRIGIYSSFEFLRSSSQAHKKFEKILVSNSLLIRKTWLEKFGGVGRIPSEVSYTKDPHHEQVYVLGSPLLNSIVWNEIEQLAHLQIRTPTPSSLDL